MWHQSGCCSVGSIKEVLRSSRNWLLCCERWSVHWWFLAPGRIWNLKANLVFMTIWIPVSFRSVQGIFGTDLSWTVSVVLISKLLQHLKLSPPRTDWSISGKHMVSLNGRQSASTSSKTLHRMKLLYMLCRFQVANLSTTTTKKNKVKSWNVIK